MHIFEIYATLIAFTILFTVCCANYLTKDVYLQVSFSILYVKKYKLMCRTNYLISNNNTFMLLKLM